MRAKSTDEALHASVVTDVILDDLLQFTLEVLLPWRPVLNGNEIPTQVLTAFSTGNWNKVPIIIGSNNDEGVLFAYQSFHFLDDVEYVGALTAIFKEDVIDVLYEYPTTWNPLTDVRGPISELLTHYLFACPSRYLSQLISENNPIWIYHFDRVSPSASQIWGPNYQYCWNKVCHGDELIYVFDSSVPSGVNMSAPDLLLSQQIVTYWTNFAHNGNTNLGATVSLQWPAFNNQTKLNILFNVTLATESWLSGYCDFWDSLGYFF